MELRRNSLVLSSMDDHSGSIRSTRKLGSDTLNLDTHSNSLLRGEIRVTDLQLHKFSGLMFRKECGIILLMRLGLLLGLAEHSHAIMCNNL